MDIEVYSIEDIKKYENNLKKLDTKIKKGDYFCIFNDCIFGNKINVVDESIEYVNVFKNQKRYPIILKYLENGICEEIISHEKIVIENESENIGYKNSRDFKCNPRKLEYIINEMYEKPLTFYDDRYTTPIYKVNEEIAQFCWLKSNIIEIKKNIVNMKLEAIKTLRNSMNDYINFYHIVANQQNKMYDVCKNLELEESLKKELIKKIIN